MAQDFVSPPPARGPVDEVGQQGRPERVSQAWTAFFGRVFDVCFAQSQSGTTAQRPTGRLYPGRRYFDTTLGYPIYWDGAQWVDSVGNTA